MKSPILTQEQNLNFKQKEVVVVEGDNQFVT